MYKNSTYLKWKTVVLLKVPFFVKKKKTKLTCQAPEIVTKDFWKQCDFIQMHLNELWHCTVIYMLFLLNDFFAQ